jgi:tRNA nucleotidyltransferase (CCA-adding enzyme)
VYTHIVKSVAVAPKNSDIRLALFLHDIGKPYCKTTDACGQDHFKGHPIISVQLATDVLKRLKVSNATFNKVLKLIEIHDLHITQKPTNIKKWLRELGEELTLDFIDVKIADMATHNLDLAQYELDTLNKIKQQTKDIIANAQPYKISDLAINGNDLIAMGYEGRAIACELDKLVQEVSANPNFNTKDKLISQAQKDKMSED